MPLDITIQEERITITSGRAAALMIVFIAVEKGMKLGLQLKGALICVNPRMLVILVYCQ